MMEPEILYSSITAIVLITIGVFAWYKGKRHEVLRAIDYLVQVAEDKFGSGTGDIKYAYVIERLYPLLPEILKFLFTEKQLDKWITESVDGLQDRIENEIGKKRGQ